MKKPPRRRILHAARLEQGLSTMYPLRGDELQAIKAWLAIRTYGERAGLPVEAYPHMLRHACGFALANQGADTRLIQDYLGHRNIQHTVRYTATIPARFERLWRELNVFRVLLAGSSRHGCAVGA